MPCEAELADYLEGVRKPEFLAHLPGCADCRAAIAMWERMDALPEEMPDAGLPFRFRQKLQKPVWPKWAAAAAAAVLVSFFAGRASNSTSDVGALRQEVRGLREVVALSLMEQQSASERLRGIRYSANLEREDTDVVATLVRTLAADPSVDVRLAAAEALRKYARQEPVKRTALALLHAGESPLVQVAAIDLLVAADERNALLTRSQDPKVDADVRLYLQQAIQKEKWQ